MTKAEKTHLANLVQLGCIACRNLGYLDTPAEVHHCRTGQGRGQRASHFETLPLCPIHHRLGNIGEAYHAAPKVWQSIHGSEIMLLEQVNALIGHDN